MYERPYVKYYRHTKTIPSTFLGPLVLVCKTYPMKLRSYVATTLNCHEQTAVYELAITNVKEVIEPGELSVISSLQRLKCTHESILPAESGSLGYSAVHLEGYNCSETFWRIGT